MGREPAGMSLAQPPAEGDRLSTSLLSQAGSQLFRIAVSIGISGWTARYLGPTSLGKLSYVAALVGVLNPLGSLGVKGSLGILLCDQPQLPGLVATAFRIELVGTLLIALVLLPVAWASRDPVVAGLMGLAVLANLFNSAEVYEVELLSQQRGTCVAKAGILETLAGACTSAVALVSQAPLMVFGAVQAAAMAAKAFLLYGFANQWVFNRFRQGATWPTAEALFKRGWPLLLAGLSVMLYMKSDQVMIEWIKGPEEVGQYSTAVKAAESIYFVPVVMTSTFLPRIGLGSGSFGSDQALRQLYKASWAIGIAMTVATTTLLSPLIPTIFGDEFRPAQGAMTWLGMAAFSVSTGTSSSAWLQKMKLERLSALRTAIGCLANILLNLVFIPREGFVGAAMATFLSYTIATFLVPLAWSRMTRKNICRLAFPFLLSQAPSK